jgi:hypothetical protein
VGHNALAMKDDGEIISFKIDRWTPETIPQARLATYLRLLAELYGEAASVHFKQLKKGSAVLESRVETAAVPKVITRLQLVKTSGAPESLAKTYDDIDELLREDNAVGTVLRGKGKIVDFPGRKAARPEPIVILQPTTVVGVVVKIGGIDESIPMTLQDAEGETYLCNIRGRPMAKTLGKYLFGDPIRVHGNGKWERSAQGKWSLLTLTVTDHEELEGETLAEAIEQLRKAAADGWKGNAMANWKREREG